MKVNYKIFELPFKHPFTISKASKTVQPTLLVELDYFGFKGYGEAPAITYYNITVDQMIADLENKRKWVEQFAFSDPERYWHYLHHLFPDNSFLVCALDIAGWDIYGKIKKKSLHEIWQVDTNNAPLTDFTIGIDDTESMVKKIKEQPWPIYKIKVGFENDIETIATLRQHTNAVFRVDANGAWNTETAMQKIPLLKDLGVELVEQPLDKNDWDGMKVLYEHTVLPLFADESCVKESDVTKCNGFFHGINIKLTKCGGITPARRMITQARSMNLKIMLGCMNESAVGTAAIAQLAPLVDYADMDGTLLQTSSVADGVEIVDGKYLFNNLPGLGITSVFM